MRLMMILNATQRQNEKWDLVFRKNNQIKVYSLSSGLLLNR